MGFEFSSSSSIGGGGGGMLDVLEVDTLELLLGHEDKIEMAPLGCLLPYPSSPRVDDEIWRVRFFCSVSGIVTEPHWVPVLRLFSSSGLFNSSSLFAKLGNFSLEGSLDCRSETALDL